VEVTTPNSISNDAPELIATENIPLVWPLVGPRLQEAIDKMEFVEYELPYVQSLLMNGQAQLWCGGPAAEMIAITRIVVYPNVKRLVVDFIEGHDHDQYTEHMEYIEHWAVTRGATQAEAELRPGLERIAKSQGWKKRRVKMFKNLKYGIH